MNYGEINSKAEDCRRALLEKWFLPWYGCRGWEFQIVVEVDTRSRDQFPKQILVYRMHWTWSTKVDLVRLKGKMTPEPPVRKARKQNS